MSHTKFCMLVFSFLLLPSNFFAMDEFGLDRTVHNNINLGQDGTHGVTQDQRGSIVLNSIYLLMAEGTNQFNQQEENKKGNKFFNGYPEDAFMGFLPQRLAGVLPEKKSEYKNGFLGLIAQYAESQQVEQILTTMALEVLDQFKEEKLSDGQIVQVIKLLQHENYGTTLLAQDNIKQLQNILKEHVGVTDEQAEKIVTLLKKTNIASHELNEERLKGIYADLKESQKSDGLLSDRNIQGLVLGGIKYGKQLAYASHVYDAKDAAAMVTKNIAVDTAFTQIKKRSGIRWPGWFRKRFKNHNHLKKLCDNTVETGAKTLMHGLGNVKKLAAVLALSTASF